MLSVCLLIFQLEKKRSSNQASKVMWTQYTPFRFTDLIYLSFLFHTPHFLYNIETKRPTLLVYNDLMLYEFLKGTIWPFLYEMDQNANQNLISRLLCDLQVLKKFQFPFKKCPFGSLM